MKLIGLGIDVHVCAVIVYVCMYIRDVRTSLRVPCPYDVLGKDLHACAAHVRGALVHVHCRDALLFDCIYIHVLCTGSVSY